MDVTIEDLKTLSRIYERLISRAEELVKIQCELNPQQNKLEVLDIYEVTEDQIGFHCEDKWYENKYIYFTFEDFVDENYIEKFKIKLAEIKEKERLKAEREQKEYIERIQKSERELLARLKAKYEQESLKN